MTESPQAAFPVIGSSGADTGGLGAGELGAVGAAPLLPHAPAALQETTSSATPVNVIHGPGFI